MKITSINGIEFNDCNWDLPGGKAQGHLAPAVKDHTHSTAPNRHFPDLIPQRLLNAALAGMPPPQTISELKELANRDMSWGEHPIASG
jgi:hypothetical protein